ncbi:MAG: phosphoribosylamine--glycine ligase [Promethearchaeota archaeon]
MTTVLLVGNGAREHAIGIALKNADVDIHAYMERRNPGITSIAKEVLIGPLTDFPKLSELVGIDYAVIGPEASLAAGFSDFLSNQGIPCVGPSKSAAKIETSKSFARRILEEVYPDANPQFTIARSLDDYRGFTKKVGISNIVVKPDGLTGGKGVKIFGEHLHSQNEVDQYVSSELWKKGLVVLEEKLVGTEFTIQAFVDGKQLVMMPLVRDYKRAFDGDKGPNTGSMGSYSRSDHGLNYVTDEDLNVAGEIMHATVSQIEKRAHSEYKGILYGQFIKTENGIKVIEYNARFGDPEAMNVLSILKTSMDKVCWDLIDGNLGKVSFDEIATVCVYVVPEGYPGPNTVKDTPVDASVASSAEVYYASVYEQGQQVLTTGSRAIGVLGKGRTVAQAREIAYSNASRIKGKVRFRTDIARGEE